MNTLTFILAFFLGFPMMIGVWIAAVKLHKFVSGYANSQTSFIVTLCTIAAAMSLMTAPAWLIGLQGYAVVSVVYVVFVALGAPHLYRLGRFLSLELDADSGNDVPLPGSDKAAPAPTDKK